MLEEIGGGGGPEGNGEDAEARDGPAWVGRLTGRLASKANGARNIGDKGGRNLWAA